MNADHADALMATVEHYVGIPKVGASFTTLAEPRTFSKRSIIKSCFLFRCANLHHVLCSRIALQTT